jgi:hypothetical protein
MYALYRNNRDGTFTYASFTTNLGPMTISHSGWGAKFFDYDNSGQQSLLIAQGHVLDTVQYDFPALRYREPMLLARNSDAHFFDTSSTSGDVFHQPWASRGMAIGDIDNDGKVDAVVATHDGPLHILHNETPSRNHWLTLNLVGHTSNRDAIGAVVECDTADGSQYATVTTAGSYLSSSDKRVHFGLGTEAVARRLEIRWPSGITQKLTGVRADRLLTIEEPTPIPRR